MSPRSKSTDPLWRMGIEYAPLLVFLAVNFLAPSGLLMSIVARNAVFLPDIGRLEAIVIARVIVSTAAFMAATVAAITISKIKLGHISPMLWITGGFVVFFGALTIYFRDPRFIQMKPTFVYVIFGALLAFGLWTGRPLLQQLLQTAYPGLDDLGWRKLTRNWAFFFAAMAVMNEIVWRTASTYLTADAAWTTWSLFKFPGCVVITLLFAFANVPMLMKHGLNLAEDPPVPPVQ